MDVKKDGSVAMDVKKDGSIVDIKASFKMMELSFPFEPDSSLKRLSLKRTAFLKVGRLDSFYEISCKSTICSCMKYSCPVLADAPTRS